MNTNNSPGFTNIQPTTVHQPAPAANTQQRIHLNVKYLISVTGIFRIALILFQFIAWICAAAVVKPGGSTLPDPMLATRSAYLFFSIVGMFIAIFLFLLSFLNIISLGFLRRLPWNIITLATNLLWILPTFICSIMAAVRETDGRNLVDQSGFNTGAFAAAAFFGFLCTIIYIADSIYHVVALIRGGPSAPPSYVP